MNDFVLGLDLGPNSIGWALLNAEFKTSDGHESYEVTGFVDTSEAGHPPMGVRVFEAGLHNFGTAKEESLCQSRRTARSMRKNHARRNARRKALKRQLVRAGLLPQSTAEQEEVFRNDPYAIRAIGLRKQLKAYDLGRALFHLGQRRGFKSNRKTGQSNEEKGMLKEIGELHQAIKESGCETLGEYFHQIGTDAQGTSKPLESGDIRIRARHTRRDMYEYEFDLLVAKQAPFHGSALTEENVKKFRHLIFFQHSFEVTEERRKAAPSRANLHRAPSVKSCPLVPSEKRCPKDDWYAQQFRIFKEVNNLRVNEHFASKDRDLTGAERDAVLEKLVTSKQASFDSLRKAISRYGADPYSIFNLERGGRSKLLGNSVEAAFKSAFGAAMWRAVGDDQKYELREALLQTEDPDRFKEQLKAAGVVDDKAEKLANWVPSDGYLAYSREAIKRLLPHLQEGLQESKAVELEFPDQAIPERFDLLPSLVDKRLPESIREITNPIVRRALAEVRKVINALVREHGLPRKVVVELAREMKQGPKQRAEASKRNRLQQNRREDAKEQVFALMGNPHSRKDIERFLLWKDQDGICLFTGKPIPQTEIFAGEWEVDHIIPRWRSLDDSYLNKVLVQRQANAEKGNRTPAEWLGPNSDAHRQLLQRASNAFAGKRELAGKYARLRLEEFDASGFAARQLNDTRFISKAVCSYLSLLYDVDQRVGEKTIMATRGGLTAELRRQWGLNDALSPLLDKTGKPVLDATPGPDGEKRKSRADHRHHAIDAVTVAAASRSALKRYQDFWKSRSMHEPDSPAFAPPWMTFREDVMRISDEINVSHRPCRRVRGALHEETMYGESKLSTDGESKAFVTRKPLASLTAKMVEQIRDPAIQAIVKGRLIERGWVPGGKSLPKDWAEPTLTTKSGVPIRKVRIATRKESPTSIRNGFVVLGNNHHLTIWKDEQQRPLCPVAPVMLATKRARDNRGMAIFRTSDQGLEFQLSLSRKESVLLTMPSSEKPRLAVLQKMSGTSNPGSKFDIFFRDSRDSRMATEANKSPLARISSAKALSVFSIRKVAVDPIGRISAAND